MKDFPKRQVHLDFHTGDIPGVASEFSKENFQEALKIGNLDSITVFAKCHHGYCYYPSRVSRQHPEMEAGFDLTGAMVEAAHEIGVRAPIYITVGWSENDAIQHPEWVRKDKDGAPMGMPPLDRMDEDKPYYHWRWLCPSGEYAELVYRQTEEVCRRYAALDGLFFDIVYMGDTCYCDNCVKEMRESGIDPYDEKENKKHYVKVHRRFAARVREILFSYHPNATVFFNSGGAEIYRPEYHDDQTHFEMEDLPTDWGGYDKFVPRASYMSRYGKSYIGMTGKFHAAWGEFGGFKNADALKYELCMMGMHGAGCSVGDQLHPSGKMDLSAYRLIGEGYRFYESFEPYFFHAENMAEVGVYLSGNETADAGLHKMLLEKQIDFAVVHPTDDLEKYKILVLPDSVTLSPAEASRLKKYTGAVLSAGRSLLLDGSFLLDTGAEYAGENPYDIDYMKSEKLPIWVNSPFLCVTPAYFMKATDGETLCDLYLPYFRRTYSHFSSHRNTPYVEERSGYAAAVRKGNCIIFAHELCSMYEKEGVQLYRDIFVEALLSLYTPRVTAKLPSAGRIHFTRQAKENRYVFYLSYAQPISRGKYSVIEDVPTLTDICLSASVPEKVKCVRVANGETLDFTERGGRIYFTLPKLSIYTAVEICY